ncbi:MAG: polysaccharide biosynthesis/export family protein [Sphingobium sp.]|nr:polysaccharide biosynthesis/export family protein [Sphingobium sp.]
MVFRFFAPVILLMMLCLVVPHAHAEQFGAINSDSSSIAGQQTDTDTIAVMPEREALPPNMDGAPAPEVKPNQPQDFDYSVNLNSSVFGANLFTGTFARQAAAQFNPNYVINVGDSIRIRMWGAYQYQANLTVDPQGNIFLPNVGPIHLRGVRNKELQATVDREIGRVFRSNVRSYASLAEAQPVRIYVGGSVHRPGAYAGTSMDTILNYIDQAGGIDPARGSFLNVEVKRGSMVRARINLYDFLLSGVIPQVQLADSDVIFVGPLQNTVKVSGLTENDKRFEFSEASKPLDYFVKLAKPKPEVTHVRVTRNQGTIKNVEYYPIEEAGQIVVQDGDDIAFTADKKPGTITVRVEGETESPQEYVLPYGTRIGELLSRIQYSARSNPADIQLYRQSVKARQKQLLDASLRSLESAVLTARSGTAEEAQLRKAEADMVLQWVERAKRIEPRGQVVISQSPNKDDLLLENGDILRVPSKDGLVLVSGEVIFPNTVAFDSSFDVGDYIARAGGFSNKADASRIIVARQDGSFAQAKRNSRKLSYGNMRTTISEGDEIMVLPKVDVKSRQIFKELTQILYQIAVSARVAVGL